MFIDILIRVILPVLIMMGCGVLVQRRLGLHMPTLSRLNIYLLVPAFIFVRVYDSALTLASIGWICTVVIGTLVISGALVLGGLRAARMPGRVAGPVVLAALLYNAGNFGIPVAELLYAGTGAPLFPGMRSNAEGAQVQGILVMLSNITLWGMGYLVLTTAHGDWRKGVLAYFKLPMIYVIIAAFSLRAVKNGAFDGVDPLPAWLRYPLEQLAAGCVPVALITLGAQLGTPPQGARRWNVVMPTVALKLLLLPAITAVVVVATNLLPWPGLHLWPWPGAQIIIAAAGPTAVNTLLLTIEVEGDAELAASCIFWSTIFGSLTATGVIGVLLTVCR